MKDSLFMSLWNGFDVISTIFKGICDILWWPWRESNWFDQAVLLPCSWLWWSWAHVAILRTYWCRGYSLLGQPLTALSEMSLSLSLIFYRSSNVCSMCALFKFQNIHYPVHTVSSWKLLFEFIAFVIYIYLHIHLTAELELGILQ